MFELSVLFNAVCFSTMIAISSSINKLVQLGALEMSVKRFAAVGGLCLFLLATCPDTICSKVKSVELKTHLLTVLSGLVFFGGSLVYISMTKHHGVVQTSIATTATSFIAVTVAGALMSESITTADLVAMVAMAAVTVVWRLKSSV